VPEPAPDPPAQVLAAPAPAPPPPQVAPSPAAPALPAPRTDAQARAAVDALLCTAAEVLDMPPRALRPALAAVFQRMKELELTVEEAVRGVAAGS